MFTRTRSSRPDAIGNLPSVCDRASETSVGAQRLEQLNNVSTTIDVRTRNTPPAHRARKARTGFRPDIEGLRAIAVTLVVLSHAGLGRFAGGYVGVDVFFVI